MSRLAAILRRWADRLDPRAAGVSEGTPGPVPDAEYGSIEQVRERQEERLREIEMLIGIVRDHEPDAGLMWFESWQLEVIARLVEHEIRLRAREFERIERAAARWK